VENTEEIIEVEFTVNYIVFEGNNNFYIFKAKDVKMESENKSGKTQISVKGIFPNAEVGDVFRASCKWFHDSKYGWGLEALSSARVLPSNINGIKYFLLKNVKGVGEKTVDKIIKAFGEASLDKIKEGGLDHIKGIPKKTKKRIYDKVMNAEALENLSVFLFQKGVTNYNDVIEIYNKMGDTAKEQILSNPYSICDKCAYTKFPLADTIALNCGIEENSPLRLGKLLIYFLGENMFVSGNIYETLDYTSRYINSFAKKKNITAINMSVSDIEQVAETLSNAGQIKIEKDELETRYFLIKAYLKECETAEIINQMIELEQDSTENAEFMEFMNKYRQETGIVLDEIQMRAVKNAVDHKISILTGGPGTGKTLTINAIIRYIYYLNRKANISLCAPTGRAAKRMSEMTGMQAYTIHRLLGIGGDFESDVELEADYLIVDESSMIDSALFHILIKAVFEAKATLILVGDKDQLPPVGAGLPFRDLIECGKVPTVKLTNLYRQAGESQINVNAKRILEGITSTGENGLRFDVEKQDFFFFPAYEPSQINNLIIRSVDGLRNIGVKSEDIIVLSPMKKTDVGVHEINRLLQKHLNPENMSKNEVKRGEIVLREGDRVMQVVNNYDLGVFNGDIGRIESIDNTEEELVVRYEDYKVVDGKLEPEERDVVYGFSDLSQLTLAYSTTVHKSQGSEYPCVIMPLSPLLFNTSRTILYTAVTRAKSRFIFIGDTESLKRGILKSEETKRNTRLKERILGYS